PGRGSRFSSSAFQRPWLPGSAGWPTAGKRTGISYGNSGGAVTTPQYHKAAKGKSRGVSSVVPSASLLGFRLGDHFFQLSKPVPARSDLPLGVHDVVGFLFKQAGDDWGHGGTLNKGDGKR